jgi:hypothetical protein
MTILVETHPIIAPSHARGPACAQLLHVGYSPIMSDSAAPTTASPVATQVAAPGRHVHHRAKSGDQQAAGAGVSTGRAAGFFVALAKTVAGIFGNAYVLAFWLVWIFTWIGIDLVSAMKFDQNFALLLALTGIPQLPLGTAILVVSNVTQRTQDAISEAQGETLQHIADLTAAVKTINDEQLEILRTMQGGTSGSPPIAG